VTPEGPTAPVRLPVTERLTVVIDTVPVPRLVGIEADSALGPVSSEDRALARRIVQALGPHAARAASLAVPNGPTAPRIWAIEQVVRLDEVCAALAAVEGLDIAPLREQRRLLGHDAVAALGGLPRRVRRAGGNRLRVVALVLAARLRAGSGRAAGLRLDELRASWPIDEADRPDPEDRTAVEVAAHDRQAVPSGVPPRAAPLDVSELVGRGLVGRDTTPRVEPHPELDRTHQVTIPVRDDVADAYVDLVSAWVAAVRDRDGRRPRPADVDAMVGAYCALAGLVVVPYPAQQLVDGLEAADPVPPYLAVVRCTIAHVGRVVHFGFRTVVDTEARQVSLRTVFPLPAGGAPADARVTLQPSRAMSVDDGLGSRLVDLRRRWAAGDHGPSAHADLGAAVAELEHLGARDAARALEAEARAWTDPAALPVLAGGSWSEEVAALREVLVDVEEELAGQLVAAADRPLDERRQLADDLWVVRTYLYASMA
jgi:hypothetical protein